MSKGIFGLSDNNKRHNQGTLYYSITLGAAFLILIAVIKETTRPVRYITDSSGNAVGIIREDEYATEEYKFDLTIENKNGTDNRNITIKKYPSTTSKTDKSNENLSVDAELTGLISDIELSKKKKIMLPKQLDDGSKLVWRPKTESDSTVIGIITCYFLIIGAIVADKIRKPVTERENTRKQILDGLPRFVNQLIMLMNSGMILSDSIRTISDSYRIIPSEDRNVFERKIIEADERYSDGRVSQVSRILELARETNVKELIRIASVLSESEKRGADISNNLSRESSFLWEERKIVAKEKGKIIDTKMSYPLAILLVMLIVITMAPALITI